MNLNGRILTFVIVGGLFIHYIWTKVINGLKRVGSIFKINKET